MKARPCVSADEMPAALAPIWHYFGQNPPSDDAIKHFRRVLPHERVHAGFDGEKIVAGTGSFPFDLTVPGGQVKAAGVTVTGVLPTHRRRGYLRAMQRSLIDDAHARGEPVAVLWATEDTIYGQFGYGMASMAAEIDVPRDHAAPFARNSDAPATRGSCRSMRPKPLIAPIYERVARVTPGMFARTVRLVAGPGAERHGVEAARRRIPAMRRAGDRRQAGRPMRSIGSIRCSSAAFRPAISSSSRRWAIRRRRPTRSGAFCSTSTGSRA